MSYKTIELAILRYRPETDQAPWFQDYRIPCEEDWVVLDAINYIKDHMDSTLSYRWSCHMAVCGSCGMMIERPFCAICPRARSASSPSRTSPSSGISW